MPVVYRVVGRHDETHDVATLELAPDEHPIAEPQPGQFTMLTFGVGEVPISVSGCPSDGGTLRHTIRAVGPVSRALSHLRAGDVRSGFGDRSAGVGRRWVPTRTGGDVVAVGGGIGVAPLRPLVRLALAERPSIGRLAVLVARAHRTISCSPTTSVPGKRTPMSMWPSRWMRPHRRGGVRSVWSPSSSAAWRWTRRAPSRSYCGPEVMLRYVAGALVERGVDPDAVWVSLERNMHCAVRRCGHCLLGPLFVCADGPVVPWSVAGPLLEVRRL